MKINCIIIEDEPLALEQIASYVEKVPFLNLKQSFLNAIDPITYLKGNTVDLIFLDIEMEDFTGIQFLKTLKEPPQIVLTTAYANYALEAFDLKVADYLLKPISFERFLQAADKVYDTLINKEPEGESGVVSSRDYIFVKTDYRIQRIDFKEILFVEGQKEYLRIYTSSGKIMTLMTFGTLLNLLPDNFVRVHNSYVVSINKIESIEKQRIKIGDQLIPISDSYKTAFFNLLKGRNLLP